MKLSGNWKLGICRHDQWMSYEKSPVNYREMTSTGMCIIDANVPGNFEADMENAGLIDPIFYGKNLNQERDREMNHLFYSKTFTCHPEGDYVLVFEGVDTAADIYLNGRKLAHVENMLMTHELPVPEEALTDGENDLLCHIYPIAVRAREYSYNLLENSLPYEADGLHIRKSAYMFGWDIFPRMLSGGIWKDVYLRKKETYEFLQSYLYVRRLSDDHKSVLLEYFCELELGALELPGLEIRLRGFCDDSMFSVTKDVWGKCVHFSFHLDDPVLWWPARTGEPKLYEVTAQLCKNGEVLAQKHFRTGIRTISVDRTSTTDRDGNGEFCFHVNGRKVFILGTNWVPLDSLPSRGKEKIAPALELVEDLKCNMIRCWGGGYYEDDLLYELCDEKGIMVWQDFMEACALYPENEEFLKEFEKEVTFQVRRLRQHPCLALWSGDNENDTFFESFTDHRVDPNDNPNTRRIIPTVLRQNDYIRDYLPSSPCIDRAAWTATLQDGVDVPEQHLWGPRDYYKSAFYKDATAHFASETGYHGCPSVESIRKFISPEALWPYYDNGEWLLHASSPTEKPDEAYAYRIELMANQIRVLFGEVPDNLEEFSLLSQISQAEAKKYFVERFRIGKWRRTGIIWWNILDGCPQFSDAVVDYYFDKKLAYHYIKRSQEMVALMCDEPENGKIRLVGANDCHHRVRVQYQVTDLCTGEIASKGLCSLNSDSTEEIAILSAGEKGSFYLMEWEAEGVSCKNHFVALKTPINKDYYLNLAEKAGLL